MSKEIEEQAQALLFLHAYKTWQETHKKPEETAPPAKSTRSSRVLAAVGSSLVTLGQRMERRYSDNSADMIRFSSVTGE